MSGLAYGSSNLAEYDTIDSTPQSKSYYVARYCPPEFLKGDRATARLRTFFQRLRKIWVSERKNARFTTVLPFLGNFSKKNCFWPILFAQNFQTEILFAQKNLLLESLLHS